MDNYSHDAALQKLHAHFTGKDVLGHNAVQEVANHIAYRYAVLRHHALEAAGQDFRYLATLYPFAMQQLELVIYAPDNDISTVPRPVAVPVTSVAEDTGDSDAGDDGDGF